MKYLISDLFDKYECIGGQCLSTCCGKWNIYVDDESYEKYKKLDSENREWILNHIENHDGKLRIKLREDNRMCPFLNEEGWCLMYRKISPDTMCDTCRDFPRTASIYYDLYALTVSLGCPEVAKSVINIKEPILFRFDEDDKEVKIDNPDWNKYNEAINGFILTVDILQDRRISIGKRLILSLMVAEHIQNHIDMNNYDGLRQELSVYSDKEKRVKLSEDMNNQIGKISNIDEVVTYLFSRVSMTKNASIFYIPIIKDSAEYYTIKQVFDSEAKIDTEYENIAVQMVFEEYMKVVAGGSIYNGFIMIATYIIILMTQEMYMYRDGKLNDNERMLLIAHLSRLIEHSPFLELIRDEGYMIYNNEAVKDLLGIIDI